METTTEEMVVIKDMPIGTRIKADPGIEMGGIEAAPGRVPNPGAVCKIDIKTEGRVETTIEIEIDPSPDLDPQLM